MTRYQIHEGELFLPENASDQSISAFGLTLGEPAGTKPPEFSFVVSRQPMPSGMTAHAYTDQQIKSYPQMLNGFRLIDRTAAPVGGQAAALIELTWQSDHGLMHQRQAILACGTLDGRPAVALSLTGTTREGLQEKYRDTFFQMLYGFKMRAY